MAILEATTAAEHLAEAQNWLRSWRPSSWDGTSVNRPWDHEAEYKLHVLHHLDRAIEELRATVESPWHSSTPPHLTGQVIGELRESDPKFVGEMVMASRTFRLTDTDGQGYSYTSKNIQPDEKAPSTPLPESTLSATSRRFTPYLGAYYASQAWNHI
jgi:hypothetical protein